MISRRLRSEFDGLMNKVRKQIDNGTIRVVSWFEGTGTTQKRWWGPVESLPKKSKQGKSEEEGALDLYF